MKRFKFSLQTVHDFREFRRDTAEREFAEATAQLQGVKAQIEELRRLHRTALDECLLAYQSHQIDASVIAAHADFIASLVRREHELRQRMTTIEKHLEIKRQALTEALRETKTTARLRERHLDRHDLELARNEQNLLDEMAVASILRRRANA